MKNLLEHLQELYLEVEKLPASEQQKKCSLLASEAIQSIGGLTPVAADVCPACNGDGRPHDGTFGMFCPSCRGTGKRR